MIPLVSPRNFTEVFSRSLTTDSATWGGYTMVLVIPSNLLSGSANTVRFTMSGPASGTTSVSHMYVGGKAASGDPYDFDAIPTQVFVGGSASFVIPQGGTAVTDDTTFTYNGSSALVVSMNITGTSNIRAVFSGAGCSYYFTTGADAVTVNKSGYDAGGSNPNLCAVVSKIEMDV